MAHVVNSGMRLPSINTRCTTSNAMPMPFGLGSRYHVSFIYFFSLFFQGARVLSGNACITSFPRAGPTFLCMIVKVPYTIAVYLRSSLSADYTFLHFSLGKFSWVIPDGVTVSDLRQFSLERLNEDRGSMLSNRPFIVFVDLHAGDGVHGSMRTLSPETEQLSGWFPYVHGFHYPRAAGQFGLEGFGVDELNDGHVMAPVYSLVVGYDDSRKKHRWVSCYVRPDRQCISR